MFGWALCLTALLRLSPQRGRVDGDCSGYQASKTCNFNFTIQKYPKIIHNRVIYLYISFYQPYLNLSYWSRWVWSSGMKKHENWRCPMNFQTNHDQPIWHVHSVYLGAWVYQRLDSISWLFTLWWTNILPWKITIFHGKIHYFYGHFQ